MLNAKDETGSRHVGRLLAGAQGIIASVPYCWLVSRGDKSVGARPMGRILPGESDDDWTIRFLTDLRSSKIADLRQNPTVSLIFQNERDDAFVSVTGAARLIETTSEIRSLWKEGAHARHFPTETDRASAGFIEVTTERLELWIRGVTPEPFGLRTTILQRDPLGSWHVAA